MEKQISFKNLPHWQPGPEPYEEILKQLPELDLKTLCERRFNDGYACPRCGSRHLHGHGRYRGRRRFRCVDCGRTFNELTMTPLHGTHHLEKWPAYICCLFWGLSLRKTARLVGISLPTAFAWRHKLLAALAAGAAEVVLQGTVELDELYVLESQKGSRHLDRPPRRRGTGQSMSRWLPHRDRACILAARDRLDGVFATVAGMGQPTVFNLEEALATTRFRGTRFCTDNRQAYWSFSIRHEIPRIVFSRPWQRRGLWHMGNINLFLTQFEKWMTRFNGVATRYLGHYVYWFLVEFEASRWGSNAMAVAWVWLLRSFDARV